MNADKDVKVVIAHGIITGRYVPYVDDDWRRLSTR